LNPNAAKESDQCDSIPFLRRTNATFFLGLQLSIPSFSNPCAGKDNSIFSRRRHVFCCYKFCDRLSDTAKSIL
jgi:hypothetical protein